MNPAERLPAREAVERALGRALRVEEERSFARYLELILGGNERAGLTSLQAPEAMVERHFAESLALLTLLRGHEWTAPLLDAASADASLRVADVGPGGGFPGVPMRIVEPDIALTLIESHGRRAGFLEEAASALELDNVEVVRARAEDAGRDADLRESFDLVVARAVAPLAVLVEYAAPLLRPGGVLAAPKGSAAADEIAAAAPAIDALTVEVAAPAVLPPITGRSDEVPATVVLARRTGDLDARYPRRAGIPTKRPLALDSPPATEAR